VVEDKQLSQGICAALSGHLLRNVFAPVHRQLETKSKSLSPGVQQHKKTVLQELDTYAE
jgi:hypothetical protein